MAHRPHDTSPDPFLRAPRRPFPGTRVVAVVALVWGLAYLVWRTGWTGSGVDPWSFWPLLTAEALLWVGCLSHLYLTWRAPTALPAPGDPPEDVDVLVTVEEEPFDEVRLTVLSAVALRGARTVMLLDDSARPALRDLAERHGAVYRARTVRRHNRTGNVNHGLHRSDAGFVLLLRPGDAVLPDALDAVAPLLHQPAVAVVQLGTTPRHVDLVGAVGGAVDRDAEAREVIQPSLDRVEAAPWLDVPSFVRRSALLAVGGLATDIENSHTQTGLRLNRAGWVIRAQGQALADRYHRASTAEELVERERLARGRYRSLLSHEGPLGPGPLPRSVRLAQLALAAEHVMAVAWVLASLTLIGVLVTGETPIRASGWGLALGWGPWTLAAVVAGHGMARGRLRPGQRLSTRLRYLGPDLEGLTRNLTDLARRRRYQLPSHLYVEAAGALGNLSVLAALFVTVTLAGLVRLVSSLVDMPPLPPMEGRLLAWATGAITAALALTMARVLRSVDRRRWFRLQEAPPELPVTIDGAAARLTDMSPWGLGLETDRPLAVGDEVTLRLWVDGTGAPPAQLTGQIRFVRERPHGGRHAGVALVDPPLDVHEHLVAYCATWLAVRRRGRVPALPEVRPAGLSRSGTTR